MEESGSGFIHVIIHVGLKPLSLVGISVTEAIKYEASVVYGLNIANLLPHEGCTFCSLYYTVPEICFNILFSAQLSFFEGTRE